jgi:hypothetical protein
MDRQKTGGPHIYVLLFNINLGELISMDLAVLSAVVAASVALTGAIGGLIVRAFIKPLETKTEQNHMVAKDHEERIRFLESQGSAHSIHLENIMKAVDRLVNKIDELVSFEKANSHNQHNGD